MQLCHLLRGSLGWNNNKSGRWRLYNILNVILTFLSLLLSTAGNLQLCKIKSSDYDIPIRKQTIQVESPQYLSQPTSALPKDRQTCKIGFF